MARPDGFQNVPAQATLFGVRYVPTWIATRYLLLPAPAPEQEPAAEPQAEATAQESSGQTPPVWPVTSPSPLAATPPGRSRDEDAPKPARRRRGLGIQIISAGALERLRAALDSQRSDTRRMLKGVVERVSRDDGFRPLARVPRNLHGRMNDLRAEMPNFADAIDVIEQQLVLRSAGDGVAHVPPILLDGPPGIGKSRFAKRLADVLGLGYTRVGMETTTAGFVIAGSSTTWGDGKPGIVANLLADSANANPLLFVDELDKVATGADAHRRYDPLGPLYALLERHTAEAWVDEAVEGVTWDASRISVIAAANDASKIPAPLLSRFAVVACRGPTQAERADIARNVYRELVCELGLRDPAWRAPLSAEVAEQLARPADAPRHMRRMVQAAMASAIRQGRVGLATVDAMLVALERMPAAEPKAPASERRGSRGPGDGFARSH